MSKTIRQWGPVILVGIWACMAQAQLLTLSETLVPWTYRIMARTSSRGPVSFVPPDQQELVAFRAVWHALLRDHWTEAHHAAANIGYRVVALQDGAHRGEVLYGLVPSVQNTDGRGYFVVRPGGAMTRNLVIEAPHPYHDRHTAVLGSHIFQALGARAFAFAGTPRCVNRKRPSPCDGLTRACGQQPQPYRESDLSHTETSFFHTFHQMIEQVHPGKMTFLQVHGFRAGPDGPAFIVSDGTRIDQPSSGYVTNRLALALERRLRATGFPKGGISCNRPGDPDRLCGTTNIQGRFTNGITTDTCSTVAHKASGRFIHLELSGDLRHPRGTQQSQMVVDAIQAALPSW